MQIIATKVTKVQIFRDGAEIVRRGQVNLEEGISKVRIQGMSRTADKDSLRLFFPKQVQLSDTRFVSANEEEEKGSDSLKEEIEGLKTSLEIKKLQVSLWKENGNSASLSEVTMQEREAYILQLPSRLETLSAEIRQLEKDIKEKEKILGKEQEKEGLPLVLLELTAKEAGTYPFEMHYFESQASWTPTFEIHTDAKAPLSVRMRARIHQYTPEDWEEVVVSLLTGKPSRGDLPELRPIYLNIKEDMPPRPVMYAQSSPAPRMASGMAKAMNAAPMMKEAMEDDLEETMILDRAETEMASVSSEETMTEYSLPGSKTIPASRDAGEGTLVDLETFEIPATYRLILVPKEDVKGHLFAEVDPASWPQTIKGNCGIYLDGIFTGETRIFPKEAGEEKIKISLGQEEALHTSRKEITKFQSKALLKNVKSTDYAYEISVKNGKAVSTEILLKDQVPVSQDKTITVETLDTSGGSLEEKTGIITWELSLEPKETKKIQLKYRVSWPKDKSLRESGSRGSSTRFCHVCGSLVPSGAFCPTCGSRVGY